MLRTTKVIHSRNGPTKTTHTSSKTYPYHPTGPCFSHLACCILFFPRLGPSPLRRRNGWTSKICRDSLWALKRPTERPINLQDFDRKSCCFWSPLRSHHIFTYLSLSLHHPLQKNAELLMTFWCFFFMLCASQSKSIKVKLDHIYLYGLGVQIKNDIMT